MSLKEQLLEELQKLRASRERPMIKQSKPTGSQRSRQEKLLEEARRLLEMVEEEE